MNRDRRMDFSEYVEWLAVVTGAAIASIARVLYRKLSIRPALEDITTRLDAIDSRIAELTLQNVENATRLEERRHVP